MSEDTPELPPDEPAEGEEEDTGFNDQDNGWTLGDRMP